ncbi:divalent-cation tolerance protein CutA [Thalassotalea nanhaiensis]|uniref:Divalent-cation tolerance protein CutA n=1 Tax=Thalassotalea nanhaiensis TaxID=3065648 RepID=A0ABY9TMZ0_9GAMM|nr:divalent-cation tolerance protein CutA [Colwelliaceae bacterium SQ345]
MYQIVVCNCPDNDIAKTIANHLVSEKLAACVNILPTMTSVYQWQDEIHCDEEVMLLIKTKASAFSELEQNIIKLHPYDVVEIVALNIQQGNELYLNWINNTVKN